jgi:predicted glycogen debranching enzyme
MYTAFVRQFGASKRANQSAGSEKLIAKLDQEGYTVIPPSGTFRDLIKQLDFIVGTLRCRIVQLLPIHPTPTTYARMGRFGSPFAVMDLFDVDPALAEFDKRTTPLDQFQELVDAVHRRNARIYLDMPINHTGWASHLQITHPEWFRQREDGSFASPGAWGVEWADLSELDYSHRELWQYMADVFLFWCRKGVDGFRCDAGYMVPFEAWEYIIAKVRLEYPDTIFMLEGLGGHKHVTERLLADAGMNWAYSEIFQNYDRGAIESYLPEDIRVSESKGNLIHFSETHDNARLAARSPEFARLRTAFCALTCHHGAAGFANGVEWLATEQIDVHESRPLNWGATPNLVDWIARLHALMEIHPAFHSENRVKIITKKGGNVAAISRTDATGKHALLLLTNFDLEQPQSIDWHGDFSAFKTDLLSVASKSVTPPSELLPGQILCLTDQRSWFDRLETRLKTPFQGVERSVEQEIQAKQIELARHFDQAPPLNSDSFLNDPRAFCQTLANKAPCITHWQWPQDIRRTVMLPPAHLLLLQAPHPFIAELKSSDGITLAHEKSMPRSDGTFFALFLPLSPLEAHETVALKTTVFTPEENRRDTSSILRLAPFQHAQINLSSPADAAHQANYAIATNQRGALAQVRLAWGEVQSKYDGLLCANLDASVPVDRHIMFTRCRGWIVRRGYSNELSILCQTAFSTTPDGAVVWDFDMPVGGGRFIPLKVTLQMDPLNNAISMHFQRLPDGSDPEHLADEEPVQLILRPDLEDRCNHAVTKAFAGPESQWPSAIHSTPDGFSFIPAPERRLQLQLKKGSFYTEPEWHYMVDHPLDRERQLDGSTDLFSPGYFKIDLRGGETAELSAAVNSDPVSINCSPASIKKEAIEPVMQSAIRAFIVRRDAFQTVIAGYPWFLDWGRDTLICLRGIIAAGMQKEAENILLQFARFERNGTIPNMIRGNDDANRETSDAPLWLFVATKELLAVRPDLLQTDCGGRTLLQVLQSIANHYLSGTPNGIQVDPESGLVFSPSHFTWMDTNYPAGTPREGYPIEIQALWFHALDFLAQIDSSFDWRTHADQVTQSIHDHFIIHASDATYLADNLSASAGTPARKALPDDALRSNQLLAITLGAITDPSLRQEILYATESLLIPGAIRSLADRPVKHPAPVYHDGKLLNDPHHPYWGEYTGDEDTRRKPAYHNGTAWTWPFPSYAEALFITHKEAAKETALALLGSATELIQNGCLGHLPEILDGNTPHTQRGCGAQAWGATELLRVLYLLTDAPDDH